MGSAPVCHVTKLSWKDMFCLVITDLQDRIFSSYLLKCTHILATTTNTALAPREETNISVRVGVRVGFPFVKSEIPKMVFSDTLWKNRGVLGVFDDDVRGRNNKSCQ